MLAWVMNLGFAASEAGAAAGHVAALALLGVGVLRLLAVL